MDGVIRANKVFLVNLNTQKEIGKAKGRKRFFSI